MGPIGYPEILFPKICLENPGGESLELNELKLPI